MNYALHVSYQKVIVKLLLFCFIWLYICIILHIHQILSASRNSKSGTLQIFYSATFDRWSLSLRCWNESHQIFDVGTSANAEEKKKDVAIGG